MYFVYVLRSIGPSRNSFYIGYTSNLLRRLKEHNSILNTGYTRNRKWRVVYVEGYTKRYLARAREAKIKQYGNIWYGVMKRVKQTL